MKTLLLEDDYLLSKHISRFLRLKGHEVDTFDDGEELLDSANLSSYDLFLFDVNVPGFSGFEIAEYIKRQEIATPIIFITAMVGIGDLTRGFELGCRDYLKKPFELAELYLRIQNVVSSCEQHDIVALPKGYSYTIPSKTLLKNGKMVMLSVKQHAILSLLLKHRGQVVAFDTIIDYGWPHEAIDYRTISSHVRDIRKKVDNAIDIKNIRGVGYLIE